jgi:hypothetical protein
MPLPRLGLEMVPNIPDSEPHRNLSLLAASSSPPKRLVKSSSHSSVQASVQTTLHCVGEFVLNSLVKSVANCLPHSIRQLSLKSLRKRTPKPSLHISRHFTAQTSSQSPVQATLNFPVEG